MSGIFVNNIETITLKNNNYRKVINTTKRSQLVVMSLKPLEEIGMETHKTKDQFIRIEQGVGMAVLNGKKYKLKDGTAVVIPAGTKHNIINISKTNKLKLYTIYTPPEHDPDTIQKNKPEDD
jgi:mannose-6-phosphate isomerase-like protein (cupin superfamily)